MWHPVLQEFPGLVSWYGKATRERVEERKALLERLLGSMVGEKGKERRGRKTLPWPFCRKETYTQPFLLTFWVYDDTG